MLSKASKPLIVLDSANREQKVWAIVADGKIILHKINRSTDLIRSLDQLLKSISEPIKSVAGFAVCSGPGSFSALRSGIALLNGLAWALDKPIYNIKTPLATKEIISLWQKLNKTKKPHFTKPIMPFYGGEPNITIKK
jgi:hypothetical protein